MVTGAARQLSGPGPGAIRVVLSRQVAGPPGVLPAISTRTEAALASRLSTVNVIPPAGSL